MSIWVIFVKGRPSVSPGGRDAGHRTPGELFFLVTRAIFSLSLLCPTRSQSASAPA